MLARVEVKALTEVKVDRAVVQIEEEKVVKATIVSMLAERTETA